MSASPSNHPELAIHTEGTDGRHNSQWLFVIPCFHVLSHLQYFSRQLYCDSTRCLRNLQAPQDISFRICKRFPLFQCDTRRQSIPMFSYQGHELEHDLLPLQDSCCLPCWECLLCALDGRTKLFVCALGNASDQVVRSRVMEVNPSRGLGRDEFVVKKVVGVGRGLNLFVACRILVWSRCCCGCRRRHL